MFLVSLRHVYMRYVVWRLITYATCHMATTAVMKQVFAILLQCKCCLSYIFLSGFGCIFIMSYQGVQSPPIEALGLELLFPIIVFC